MDLKPKSDIYVVPVNGERAPKSSHTVSEAIEVIGMGKVQYLAVLAGTLCLLNFLLDVIGPGFVLPAAACDLQLDTYKMGLLLSTPFLGLMLTAHLWGFLSDTMGRKKCILISLCSSLAFSCLAILIPNFWAILMLRFCSGLVMAGCTSAMYPYIGEFLTNETRSKFMIFIGYSTSCSMFLLSGVGWALRRYGSTIWIGSYALTTWRMQVLILAIPGLIGAYIFHILPESPRFLLSVGKSEKAMEVLREVHYRNGNCKIKFPIQALEGEQGHTGSKKNFFSVIKLIFGETILLFKKPCLWPVLSICFIQFGLFTVGAAFAIWYPELANRLSANEKGGLVCDIFQAKANLTNAVSTDEEINWDKCTVDIQDKMFIDNLYIGLGYVVINTAFYFFNMRIKILYIIVAAMTVSSASAFLLPSLTDNTLIMIAFTVFIVGSGACISIFNVLVVGIFPTFICGMAISLGILAGRIGSFLGSNGFGVLLENHCELTIYGIGTMIAANLICVLLLPQKIEGVK